MGQTRSSMMIVKELEMGEALPETSGIYRLWTDVRPCIYQSKRKATVFIRSYSEIESSETRNFFSNGLQTLRQLRHPCILEFYASSESCRDGGLVCLVTERVKPLDLVIENIQSIEIQAGLTNIVQALVFLHDKAGRSHNNICPSAVFVTVEGRWKLGSFECSQKLQDNKHWMQTDFFKTVKLSPFVPPEDEKMINNDAPCHARDSYGFGKLVEYAMPYFEQDLNAESRTELELLLKSLTAENAALRPELDQLLQTNRSFMSNDLSAISATLQRIHLLSADEKSLFLESLLSRLRELPADVIGRRLTKLLLSRYVLLEGDACRCLLPYFLKPKVEDSDECQCLLPMSLYRQYVAPQLLRIFCVRETSVRLAILSQFSSFVPALDRDVLKERVLPELILGTKDTNELIVAASFRCLSDLVPILGGPAVTGLEHRKYFSDGKPKGSVAPLQPKNDAILTNLAVVQNNIDGKLEILDERVEKTNITPVKNDHSEHDLWTDDDWNVHEIQENTAENSSRTATSTKVLVLSSNLAAEKRNSLKSSQENLGSEFDVLSLDVKREEDSEANLFADMEPKFKSSAKILLNREQENDGENQSHFLVMDSFLPEVEVGSGWTLDWDED